MIYLITFILALCSILYELLLAQTISFFAANTVVWYSVTIGVYLGSMGLGALWCQKIVSAGISFRLRLFKVEWLLSLCGAMSVAVVHYGHMLLSFLWAHNAMMLGVIVFFGSYFFMVVIIGILTGMELPLLLYLAESDSRDNGATKSSKEGIVWNRRTNRILGADYFGSLAGGVLFPLVLYPRFELLTLSLLVAATNLVMALFIVIWKSSNVQYEGRDTKPVVTFGAGVLSCLLAGAIGGALIQRDNIQQYFLKKFYYHRTVSTGLKSMILPVPSLPDIERYRSAYQKIDIVKIPRVQKAFSSVLRKAYQNLQVKSNDEEGNAFSTRFFINGDFQWSTNYEQTYHEYLAHVPVILNQRVPKDVLIIGAGDGLLLRELLKYQDIEHVTLVELDQVVLNLVHQHPLLQRLSEHALDDPRVKIVVHDGYDYIRRATARFDAIYLDVPIPNDYNLSKLYSREFYHFVRQRLNSDGYVAFEAPQSGVFSYHDQNGRQQMAPENIWEIYYHTLKAAGFNTIVPYVSNLEFDNRRAIEGMYNLWGGGYRRDEKGQIIIEPGRKASIVKEAIIQYILAQQEGFIMVKEKSQQFFTEYYDIEEKFNVKIGSLNARRFGLAFQLPYNFPAETNLAMVNSILRPTLPKSPLWWIKQP